MSRILDQFIKAVSHHDTASLNVVFAQGVDDVMLRSQPLSETEVKLMALIVSLHHRLTLLEAEAPLKLPKDYVLPDEYPQIFPKKEGE